MIKKESRRRSPAALALSHMLSHIETRFLRFLHLFLRKNTMEKEKEKADNPLKNTGVIGFFCLARPEGFEPPAFGIGIHCDIQLRHGRKYTAHRMSRYILHYFAPVCKRKFAILQKSR